ncbi:MAG: alpha-amylase family glycosyl hydrolase [Candidatus Latescibacterota bacterium]
MNLADLQKAHGIFMACFFAVIMLSVACAHIPPASAAGDGDVAVTFTFVPPGAPVSVCLAGSFNEWNSSKYLMSDEDEDGVYEFVLQLQPGTYEYKFVVDDRWMEDPYSDTHKDDGHSGKNSVIIVPDNVESIVAGVGRGKGIPALTKPPKEKAAPEGSINVTFVFDAGGSANVVVAGTFNNWSQDQDKMSDEDGDGIYKITLPLTAGRYEYKFVRDGQWLTDETAAEFKDDGFGGKNSIIDVPHEAGEEGMIVGATGSKPDGAAEQGEGAGKEAGGKKFLKQVTFRFQPVISGVTNVFLAGTFNDWNDSKVRMTDEDGDGAYEVTLLLPVGRYQYKFVADGAWITDDSAADFADDGFGGKNSILVVDESYEDVKIELGDGAMMHRDIPFVMDYSMVNPLGPGKIEFRTRAHLDDVEDVYISYAADGGKEEQKRMVPDQTDGVFQYYQVVLNVPAASHIRFTFAYADGDNVFYATPGGIDKNRPQVSEMFEYSEAAIQPFFTPDWAKNGVFYQIFPERFRNGDPSNDPDFSEPYYEGVTKLPSSGKTNGEYFHFVDQWENVTGLTQSPYRTDGKPDYYSFYGGDIAGVMEKLPYLADLGITIIYFNPLNEARSNHKYDPMDYLKIDPHFADEATFKEFVRKAHELGIRIIVDKAFNHTGNWHFAFIDSREKGRESKYWDWYEWKRWPLPEGDVPNPLDYYDCWWGFGIHPNLNFDLSRVNSAENNITDIAQAEPNEALVQYILEVARYWLGELDIDGFRLDVPNEVPFRVWQEFRKVVDEVKPDAFLIGEIWGNAMPWLGPHCFHSTMNYKYFRDPVLKFFGLGQGNAAQLDRELAPGRSLYPLQATQVMMNLIDSHDTERFVTVAGKDDRLMLAALFQMTYVGIPQIYYGDEVGLKGGKDPDCRRTFPWNWQESPRRKKIHDFYTKILSLRHQYEALRTGRFETVLTDGRVYSYVREDDNNRIIIVLNNEGSARRADLALEDFGFTNGARLVDALSGGEYTVGDGKISIDLEALTGAVLVLQ